RRVAGSAARSSAMGRRGRQRGERRCARRETARRERESAHAMMRLPLFEFRAPQTVAEAARILDGEGPRAMPLAGGTDLLPNMKRRQQVPQTLMSLRQIEALHATQFA